MRGRSSAQDGRWIGTVVSGVLVGAGVVLVVVVEVVVDVVVVAGDAAA